VAFFYQIIIQLVSFLLPAAALFNKKIKLFTLGRKNVFEQAQAACANPDNVIWFHCASLGEFEQALPLIHSFKSATIKYKVVVTFFSPSGYEVRKDFKGVDAVFYLPMDTKKNAKRWVDTLNPKKVFFIKYDFWYNYFSYLHEKKIPLYVVSATFRPHQFKGFYGVYLKQVLRLVDTLFVQNEESAKCLHQNGFVAVHVAGDLRFDKVAETALQAKRNTLIEYFKGADKLLLGGSTWEAEETLLASILHSSVKEEPIPSLKLIVAPHEVNEKHIASLLHTFPQAIRYSQISTQPVSSALIQLKEARVLVVDTIGLLSSLYQYADVAFIGGGFGKGIHNIVEATAFGVPTLFGPNHVKFPEAKMLMQAGAAFEVSSQQEAERVLHELFKDKTKMAERVHLNHSFVQSRKGATERIMQAVGR
jgi:3-deoxy-D-manno-octulosonic-acid transferase